MRLLPAELALLAVGCGVLFDEKVGVALTRGLDLQSRPIGKSVLDARLTVFASVGEEAFGGISEYCLRTSDKNSRPAFVGLYEFSAPGC